MPNDIPDWTSQSKVNLVGGISGLNLGDIGAAAAQVADQEQDTITTGGTILGIAAALASFKASGAPALVAAGTLKSGTATSVTPAFGQAPAAGSLLVAVVSSPLNAASVISSGSAGWVQAADNSVGGGAAIWYKPNSSGSDAAPTFTCGAGGSTPMMAQLVEYSGIATTSPVDRTNAAPQLIGTTMLISMSQPDAVNGDLVVAVLAWVLFGPATAAFSDVFNNGAAAVALANSGASSLSQHQAAAYAIIPAPVAAQPLGVALVATTRAPQSIPQSTVLIGVQVNAASSSSVIIPRVAGQSLYLFGFSATLDAVGGTTPAWSLQRTQAATDVWQGTTNFLGPHAHDFKGVNLGSEGIAIHNYSSTSITVRGAIEYSQV